MALASATAVETSVATQIRAARARWASYRRSKGTNHPETLRAGDALRGGRHLLGDVRRCVRGRYDSLASIGIPTSKQPWNGSTFPVQGPSGLTFENAYAYDATNYLVFSRRMHGVTVVVAVHRGAVASAKVTYTPRAFATAVMREFHHAWHVYGGFRSDRYVFKIRGPNEPFGLVLSGGGVALDADDYGHRDQTHEMFHAWNGGVFEPVPDASDALFQMETWIVEGATIYHAARIDGQGMGLYVVPRQNRSEWFYNFQANGLYGQYLERVRTPYDQSYAVLASHGGTESSEWQTMLAARGFTLNYLVDRELQRSGSSNAELLRYLYRTYGLTGRRYTNSDVLAFLRRKLGPSHAQRFLRYLNTSARLRPELGSDVPYLG